MNFTYLDLLNGMAADKKAADGPEVEIIRFFTRFPQGVGAVSCSAKTPFAVWQKVAEKVRPNV